MDKKNTNTNTNNVSDKEKELLIELIKEWMNLETSLHLLKKETKIKNQQKKQLSEQLITIMKPCQIDRFDIQGGSLIYKKNKSKKPLNKKTLQSILQSFYPEKPEMAQQLSQYILENREETVKDVIKHITK